MTKVLVGTDGSDTALKAAKWCDSVLGPVEEYVVLAVARPTWAMPLSGLALTTPLGGPVGGYWPEPGRLGADAEAAEQAALAEAHAEARATAGLLPGPIRIRSEVGRPGETLCRVASEEDADLIVVGSHGRGLAIGMLLGSVSRYVVKHAHRPVLIVPFE